MPVLYVLERTYIWLNLYDFSSIKYSGLKNCFEFFFLINIECGAVTHIHIYMTLYLFHNI